MTLSMSAVSGIPTPLLILVAALTEVFFRGGTGQTRT